MEKELEKARKELHKIQTGYKTMQGKYKATILNIEKTQDKLGRAAAEGTSLDKLTGDMASLETRRDAYETAMSLIKGQEAEAREHVTDAKRLHLIDVTGDKIDDVGKQLLVVGRAYTDFRQAVEQLNQAHQDASHTIASIPSLTNGRDPHPYSGSVELTLAGSVQHLFETISHKWEWAFNSGDYKPYFGFADDA